MTCSLKARKCPEQGRNPCVPALSIHQIILLSTPSALRHRLGPALFLGCLAAPFLRYSPLYDKRCVTSSASSPVLHWAALVTENKPKARMQLRKSDYKVLDLIEPEKA